MIAGELPEDTFGQHMLKPMEPIETPDDLLTSAYARTSFMGPGRSEGVLLRGGDSADDMCVKRWGTTHGS